MHRVQVAAHCASLMPPRFRERALFGGIRRQILLQKLIGGPFATSINYSKGVLRGLTFSCLTSEKYFWLGADYEQDAIPLLRQALDGAQVAYDIGAHVGFYSLLFARLCPQVFSFEPDPTNRSRLKANVSQMSNIDVLPYAISDTTATLRLEQSSSTSHIVKSGGMEVRAIALDGCGLPGPNFIKLDIEGHGAKALAGAQATIRATLPKMLIEIHNDEERNAVDNLRTLGYRMRHIDAHRSYPFRVFTEVKGGDPSS